jgi:hypothetical protein
MAANLHVISGQLRLNRFPIGHAEVDFSSGGVSGDASRLDVLGAGRDFRSRPHVLVSPSEGSLSTHDNTFFRLNRSVTEEKLILDWRIDRATGGVPSDIRWDVDFLVIGVPR